MPELSPTLTAALAAELAEGLEATADSWIRAELPHDWPVGNALQDLVPYLRRVRVGVLSPFRLDHVANMPQATVSADPSEITRWRGQPLDERSAWHTIVLGDARGRLEAGLQSVLRVVTHVDVLQRWDGMLLTWLREEIHTRTAQDLFKQLINLAIEGQIDANAFDEYVAAAAAGEEEEYLEHLRSLLWYMDLFPDRHVLDAGRAQSRLERSFFVKTFLLAATDTPVELTRLRRLETAAEQGNRAAWGALEYRATHDRRALEGVELEAVRHIIEPARPRSVDPPSPRPLDLFGFLDAAAGVGTSQIQPVLDALRDEWDLDAREEVELFAAFGDRNVRVLVTPIPPEGNQWTGTGEFAEQSVAFMGGSDADRDWLRFVGKPVSGDMLLERARDQDEFLSGTLFETLATKYLEAREVLVRYERWLRESAFELLLVFEDARVAVRRFLDTWHELVDAASEAAGEAEMLRKELALLEAIWGAPANSPEDFAWCAFGPLHPYLLEPLASLVETALVDLGAPELGAKLEWALERAIPAFSVTWAIGKTYFLARRGDVHVFEAVPSATRPAVRSGDGLYQLARAFVGYHPYTEQGLVITLVDPPKGGAVQKSLRRIADLTQNLRIYLVTTRADSAQLDEVGETVQNLGRFENLEEWLRRAPVTSHLLVYFATRPAAAATPAPADWGPTSGAHIALQVQLRSGGLFDSGLSPSVTFEPRESNRAVVSLQQLAAPEIGTPDLFQIHPMLSSEASEALGDVAESTDWLVVAAPSPLGLVAPRELGSGLTYLGRESIGAYGLFAYATGLFPLRKYITEKFRDLPLLPNADEVEARLMDLAIRSPNGVLRIGGTQGKTLWEQVGVMVATTMSEALDS